MDPLVAGRLSGALPLAVLPPVLLLGFTAWFRILFMKEERFSTIHSLPPRLAMTAVGILISSTASLTTNLGYVARGGQGPLILAVLVVLFFFGYLGCEAMYLAAKKGGARQWWTVGGAFLAVGMASLAMHSAREILICI